MFSFYPAKNLGVFGVRSSVVTQRLADSLRLFGTMAVRLNIRMK